MQVGRIGKSAIFEILRWTQFLQANKNSPFLTGKDMFVKLRLYKEGIYGKQPEDQQVIF